MAANNSRRARASRKRQRRMKRVEHDLDAGQWSALVDAWGGCAYCGDADLPLQKDCVMALSRGGRYTLGNIVPACRSCNASKSNTEVTAWMRRKRLDEQRFLVRYHEISTALVASFADDDEDDGDDGDAGERNERGEHDDDTDDDRVDDRFDNRVGGIANALTVAALEET